jgi:putative transposase
VLKLLGVSSSGYYSWLKRTPSNQEIRKQNLKAEIAQIYNESHQIYGAPKITSILQSRGHVIAEKTVGNYMREEGIRAIWVSPYIRTTIDPDFDKKLKNINAQVKRLAEAFMPRKFLYMGQHPVRKAWNKCGS